MSWRTFAPIAAVGVAAWALAALVYLAPFGGAGATPGGNFADEEVRLHVQGGDGLPYTVVIQMLLRDGETPAGIAEARRVIAGRFPGAVLEPKGEVSAQYVEDGFWWPAHEVAWAYDAAGKPAALTGEAAALAAAAATWNGSVANWRFTGGGLTSAGTGACGAGGGGMDGQNTIGWAPQPGNVLAVTCSWYGGGSPARAAEFDMQIDPGWNWTTAGRIDIDLQSVVTHELGHALGLAHTHVDGAVMFASYCAGCDRRSLTADDIAGLVAIYGAAPVAQAVQPQPTPAAPPPPPAASLALLPGANLLTWQGDDSAPASALAPRSAEIAGVYGFDGATQSWLRYLPGLPPYASNLTILHRGQAYWFFAAR